ncbi:amino acid kinase family protein [Actinocorallia aurea]
MAALGGNALLRRGERPDAAVQLAHVAEAVAALAPLAAEHELLITHGNGPQIGMLALESAADPALSVPYPLDALNAQTQGLIGSWLVRALRSALPGRRVVALLTDTVVAADDPAFERPTKFIGRQYTREEAGRLAGERGWAVARDGDAWRRVVPSPAPLDVVELPAAGLLLDAGWVVVAGGGGGAPVRSDGTGGVEAVVDKDFTSALMAERLGAEVLLLLTDVPNVIAGYGTDAAEPVGRATPARVRALDLPAGSMGPKAEAACRFAEHRPGVLAAIGALGDAPDLVAGRAGTRISLPAASETSA